MLISISINTDLFNKLLVYFILEALLFRLSLPELEKKIIENFLKTF
jgi:hypothetical protein